MKISIVTVTYNCEATIADTLCSVASQTYGEIEHILVDGESTDRTLHVARSTPSRLKEIVSEPDAGIYDAMNKGLRHCTGDVIGFLNGDDLLADSGAIARLCARMTSRTGVVYGDLQYFSAKNAERVVRHWKAGYLSSRQLMLGWMPPHPTVYARREIYQLVGEYDTSLSIAADYDMCLRLLASRTFDVAYEPTVLVKMRLGGVSNRSVRSIVHKSREDLQVIRRHRLGGLGVLLAKNVRKLPQFLA